MGSIPVAGAINRIIVIKDAVFVLSKSFFNLKHLSFNIKYVIIIPMNK